MGPLRQLWIRSSRQHIETARTRAFQFGRVRRRRPRFLYRTLCGSHARSTSEARKHQTVEAIQPGSVAIVLSIAEDRNGHVDELTQCRRLPRFKLAMRILVVEDEPKMAELIRKGLDREHYSVLTTCSGPDGLALALASPFNAIVLDVMLPGFDGFELARRLRSSGSATPILFLTARDTEDDLVRGLDGGGDDYLTKPFSFREFLARLRAITRRLPHAAPTVFTIADLTLDRFYSPGVPGWQGDRVD